MLVESVCIVLILSIMCFVFLRSHHKDYVIATAPLIILPFVHALANVAGDFLHVVFSVDVKAMADVLGLAIGVALIGMVSMRFKAKKSRLAYLIVSAGFSAILALIFITSYYSGMVPAI